MDNSEIEKIEDQIKVGKELAAFGAAIERLKRNKDFQEVVLKGYFEKEAIRLVNAKAVPHLQSPESQRSILRDIDAIGSFHQFLNLSLQRAEIGTTQVAEGEDALAELHAEEAAKGSN